MYIRFNQLFEQTNYRYEAFILDVRSQLSGKTPKKVIVDLRTNLGGNLPSLAYKLVDVLNEAHTQQICVLIDGRSYSCAVVYAVEIMQNVENVVLVGSTAGQMLNFCADSNAYTLPNSGYTFVVSDKYWRYQGDMKSVFLVPDITLYQTLEDYMNGIDTVLEFVKDQDRQE